jgi:antitoxin component YwqK of YwqJK toxin-antitoxin module
MRGYKIFGPDYTCRGYKYSLTDWNICEDEPIDIFKRGFHFCPLAVHCLDYYSHVPENTYAEVECGEEYILQGDVVACKKLKIVKTLTYEEFGKLLSCEINTSVKKCTYVCGALTGVYTEWYPDGQLKIRHDYNTNEWKQWYPDGQLNSEYDITTNVHKIWHNNGNLMLEKQCDTEGKPHGSSKRWYKCGNLSDESEYVNGQQIGVYKLWYENGNLCEETQYVNGMRNGYSKTWYPTNTIKNTMYYKDNKKHGKCTEWYPNGQLYETLTYVDNKIHGVFTIWYENGLLNSKRAYVNGKQRGKFVCWRENGKLLSKGYIIDGKFEKLKRWDESGKLIYDSYPKTWKYKFFAILYLLLLVFVSVACHKRYIHAGKTRKTRNTWDSRSWDFGNNTCDIF